MRLVVFNPAGLRTTRNWPASSYVELFRPWSTRDPVRILLPGTDGEMEKGILMGRESGRNVINLAEKRTAGEAFAILRHAAVIVKEDMELIHAQSHPV